MLSRIGRSVAPVPRRLRTGRALALVALISIAEVASAGNRAPCGSMLSAYPVPGQPPAVKVWHRDDLRRSTWQPPPCTDWERSSHSQLVVAMAGSFRFDGASDELVARLGAISALRGVRYWSVNDKAWRPFASDASALVAADPRSRRADFPATELTAGSELYYSEKHSRSGNIVYRMTVLERSSTRAVIATENVSPVKFLFLTLFEPGALQSIAFLEQVSPGIWGICLLTRASDGASPLARNHDASYINRATAIYRHLAGIPTDQEPPAAR